MQPAHERLDADVAVIAQPHDRLVPHAELLALDGVAQVGFEPEAAHRLVVERRVEHRIAAGAGVLRAVHRQVGVADDVFARLVGIGGHGHADARAREHILPVELQRLRGHELHTFGDAHGIERLADAVEQHREFVAAEPRERRFGQRAGAGHTRHHVFGAHGCGESFGEHHEQAVTGGVAEAVVHVLERSRSTNSTANW
jgi:hypothetical protein